MSPITVPKANEQVKSAFQSLLPPDSAVTTRPMFGNLSAFVNGNMFAGVFGEGLFVRVSEGDQAKIKKQGGKPFEPMPGRPMTGYVMLPPGWQKKSDGAREWIHLALAWSKTLPPKTKPINQSVNQAAKKPVKRR